MVIRINITLKNSVHLVTKIYIPVRPTKKTLELNSDDETDEK